jgi:HEAT repeat protein
MKHRQFWIRSLTLLSCLVGAAAAQAQNGAPPAEQDPERALSGRALMYREFDKASLESLTTPEHLLRVAEGGFAPTEIWRALEHGEKVECLKCIPAVSKLLFNSNAKTREISAWWLRRRVFGVFGPGEAYQRVVTTLGDLNESERRRAYAADALGEFLVKAGTVHVANASANDPSPLVRASAVRALVRLNSAGPGGELARALSDTDESVRLAAVLGSTRVNVFTGIDALAGRIDDPSSAVRTSAIEALGALGARDSVVALIAKLAPANEAMPSVRAAAAAALGELGDSQARTALSNAQSNDPDRFVRDAARVALRRL